MPNMLATTSNYGASGGGYRAGKSLEEIYELLGLGKAQVFIWMTLTLVAYADVSEIVVISILIPYLRCEWDLEIWFEGMIGAASLFFYAIGSILFGSLSDKYGRRLVLAITVTVMCFAGIASALATNKWEFLVARVVVGLCIGANFPTCVVFSSEVTCAAFKEYGITILLVAAGAAVLLVSGLGYLFVNVVGWRWFLVIVLSPSPIALLCLICIPESPRYLLASGNPAQAVKSLRQYFKWNGKVFPEGITITSYKNQVRGVITQLFAPAYRKETVLLAIMYFSNMVVIYGQVVFLPLALDSGFCGALESNPPAHKCKKLGQESLGNLTLINIGTIIACVLGVVAIKKIGRVLPLRILSAIVLALNVCLYVCINTLTTDIIYFLIVCSSAAYNIILWIIIPEFYPTVIRNTATGYINFWGKIGGAIGTVLVYVLFYVNAYLVVSVFVLAAVMGVGAAFLWNTETKDKVYEDLAEVESEY